MTRDPRQRRFPLFLNDQEAEAVAEYRWKNRIPSQTEAVRQLIAKGLQAEGANSTEEGQAA